MLLREKHTEEFHVFYLDIDYKLILDELHSSGTVDWAPVFVREIVKKALDLSARNIVLVHNHPSQIGTFSTHDIQITQELETALNGLEIKLYDHLLVAGDIVHSARNMFFLK